MAKGFIEKKIQEAADTLDPRVEQHRQKLLTLASTKRHIVFSYPADMTDQEILDFAGWILTGFRGTLPRQDGLEIVRGTLDGVDGG